MHRKLILFDIDGTLVLTGVAGGRAMLDEAASILAATKGRPHIFNLGHGIVPHTPPEHVAALMEFLRAA